MATSLRRVDDRADRLHIRLDRPEVRNAIDQTMVDELHEVCSELEARPRILILSGTERVFASGADIAQLRERGRDDALAGINSRLFLRIATLPMPVIAAVDGWALGGGAELAYAADFRLAGDNARFGNPEVGLGIIAAAGATWRLKELVGESLALEVLLAGRVLDAQEALAAGLVTEVHPPSALIAAADGLADRIAEQDPLAVRYTKRVFRAPREAHPDVDELAQSVLFESPAKRERMTDFLERKKR
ncbi:enoyl-CoA hydratase/isomerase family protein [Promicromonospora soli]|uniref:Enoyl-CoA hydratase/isomerase n=1 Tax=Promicromonospora soli TaxID=2035533 RepID=A0A919FVJ6_9MICO|nr:enoyl-CoA hydratase/isomerase family protein [Promicromonospora soli]GHH73116.1 putative enoyl-CoA hydratase/isomerase [Promicromonospora soli]